MPRKPKKGVVRGTDDQKEIGARIRFYREQKGLSQTGLSSLMNGKVSSRVLSRYENGGDHMQVGTFFAFAEAFNVTPNDLCPRRLLVSTGHLPLNYLRLTDDEKISVDTIINSFLDGSLGVHD